MARKYVITLLVSLLVVGRVCGEMNSIGTPFIRNFTKQDYGAGTHNWAIAQDLKGFMYFANDDGLLVYDGVQWDVYRMPNLSMVRSLYIDNKGTIYIGAYNDLGRMVTAGNGKLTFTSFKDMIPERYRNFDDVWNVLRYGDNIVFQSYNAAYFYNESGQITVVEAPSRFLHAFSVNGRLLFDDTERGLVEYKEGRIIALEGCGALAGQEVSSLLPYGNESEILICTRGMGLFILNGQTLRKWNIPVNEQLQRAQVFSAAILPYGYYALGTVLNGVMIIDQNGSLVQAMNKKAGLQNNTVLSLFPDGAGNLWLALDNGIDYATINSPVTFIQNSEGFGAGYASVIHDGRLYLGTNQGLYVREWPFRSQGDDYRIVPGTNGQVWYLGVHNGVLICGHDKGTYSVSGERAVLINNTGGGWKYMELKNHPGYMIGGTYSGIILFRYRAGTWEFVRQINGINESFRVFEEDEQGDIWMSHGFKGIFRVRLNDRLDSVLNVRFYNSANGLPSDYYLSVFKIKEKIIVTSETEIYEYKADEDRFARSHYFNQMVSPLVAISYIIEDQQGNIWYVAKNRTGVFRVGEDLRYQHITSPFILLSGTFIHGFESIYCYSPDHIFFGTEDGFAHYSPGPMYTGYQEFSAYITRAVALHEDSVFFFGSISGSVPVKKAKYSFSYSNNSFRFTYSSPVYDNAGNTEYSYRLVGFNDQWSPWSRSYVKEYSNLPDGRFTFQVKARNQLGVESLPDSLDFIVQHPWYKTPAAFISYFLIGMTFVLIIIWSVNRRFEKAKLRERLNDQRVYEEKEQAYKRQALEAEKEIIRIRNENLQAEMIQRDKELANQAMNLIRINEFLTSLKDDLNKIRMHCVDGITGEKIQRIISDINREVGSNRQREIFETAFDEVHQDFLVRLKAKYPSLTPTEQRMCAFLKMNMSTKEIAPLMNISTRGVEICRYRIRKKMGIPRDTSLTGLLLNL